MKGLFIFVSVLLLIFSVVGNSEAVILEWDFTADNGGGATVTGSFGWEDSALDQDSADHSGLFYTGFLNASVSGGPQHGLSFSYSSDGTRADGEEHVRTWWTVSSDYWLEIDQWISESDDTYLTLFKVYGLGIGSFYGDELLDGDTPWNDFSSITIWLGDYEYEIRSITEANSAPAPVPEPATMLLLSSGLLGLAGLSRKKFRK
jgi:hypothetical protein